MNGEIKLEGQTITYELIHKNVKNINIRITDGLVRVSASPRVSQRHVEELLIKKSSWLLKHFRQGFFAPPDLSILNSMTKEEKLCKIHRAVQEMLPLFEQWNVSMPTITVRRMTTRWGSCSVQKKHITLNEYLLLAPQECLEYVAAHELAHFVYANHSKDFYQVLSVVVPDYKNRRRLLAGLHIL